MSSRRCCRSTRVSPKARLGDARCRVYTPDRQPATDSRAQRGRGRGEGAKGPFAETGDPEDATGPLCGLRIRTPLSALTQPRPTPCGMARCVRGPRRLPQVPRAQVSVKRLLRALAPTWPDFEDSVCAGAAEAAGCDALVTRDPSGFPDSPLPVVDPLTALALLSGGGPERVAEEAAPYGGLQSGRAQQRARRRAGRPRQSRRRR